MVAMKQVNKSSIIWGSIILLISVFIFVLFYFVGERKNDKIEFIEVTFQNGYGFEITEKQSIKFVEELFENYKHHKTDEARLGFVKMIYGDRSYKTYGIFEADKEQYSKMLELYEASKDLYKVAVEYDYSDTDVEAYVYISEGEKIEKIYKKDIEIEENTDKLNKSDFVVLAFKEGSSGNYMSRLKNQKVMAKFFVSPDVRKSTSKFTTYNGKLELFVVESNVEELLRTERYIEALTSQRSNSTVTKN